MLNPLLINRLKVRMVPMIIPDSNSFKNIRVGARGSRLAQIQVDEVREMLRANGVAVDFEVSVYQNQGDLDKISSLLEKAADNFFTDALDHAVLDGEIDVAIHSAKDLPQDRHADLDIFALTPCLDETDAFVGVAPLVTLSAGSRIGTSSLLRQQQIRLVNPEVDMVSIRGTIQDRIAFFKEGAYDGIIVATAALKRLGLTRYITEILPWDTTPLQGQLAVVGRRDNAKLRHFFEAIDVRRQYGKVVLVGAGPGDPELITLKGVSALRQADVVFYDYLAHKGILKHAVGAEKIYVGKKRGDHAFRQPEISRLIRQRAQQGNFVVRLKGGDPLLFARGAEEMRYLRDFQVTCDVVPGVSSATGIPAELGIPLTARGVSSSVALVSAYGKEESSGENRAIQIPLADTLIFFMGISKLESILEVLNKQGYKASVPIAIVSRGTFIDEKVVVGTLGNISQMARQARLTAPALIIVGDTVSFYQKRVLSEQTILYTGTNPEKYSVLGRVIPFPMIQIRPKIFSSQEVAERIQQLSKCQIILLTSQFGVKYFFEFLNENHVSMDAVSSKKFLVIGRHTAQALEDYGVAPNLMADVETSRGLIEKIKDSESVEGKQILFPRSNLPNPLLADELMVMGAHVDQWAIYENIKVNPPSLPDEHVDAVFFTSPSTVKNFLEFYDRIPEEWLILCKGDVTRECLRSYGYEGEILVNS